MDRSFLELHARDARLPLMGYWRMRDGDARPYWSPELFDIFGLRGVGSPPEAEKLPALFEDPEAFGALRQRTYADGDTSASDLWIKRGDGARRLVRICAGVERTEGGRVSATYGLVVDVTDLNEAVMAAHANEQLLATFVDHAPAALAMFDTKMRYVRVSPRWIADYGLNGQDIIGRSHYEVFPEVPQRWKDIHARCLAGAVERSERDPFDRRDGARQWLSWEVRPWKDASGATGGLLMLTRDITELVTSIEATEQTERRLHLALEASEMLVWQRDRASMQVIVSGATSKLLGQSERERLSWEEIWNLVHEEDRDGMMVAFADAVRTRTPLRMEHRICPRHAQTIWVLSVIEPLFDVEGAHIGSIGLIKDVTAQRAEKEALRDARAVAETASRAKSEFLATMSHELRTPMNGLLGAAQALKRTQLSAHQRALVDLMLSSGQTLRGLVDDALDIGRIEADQLRLECAPFDLGTEIEGAARLHAATADAKNLELLIDVSRLRERVVLSDAVRLRQIVGNLVGNAVKFTRAGRVVVAGDVKIDADGLARCLVMVRDTGPGVAEGDREHIFERYEQRHRHDTLGGAGLGLHISRGLARALGGDVRCIPTDGTGGACFLFEARLAMHRTDAFPLQPSRPQPFSPALALPRLRILVAEDNPLNQQIVALLLEPLGSRLVFASDGSQALSLLDGERFDLVLMDLQMPRMGGLEAIRAIRAREAAAGCEPVPILCLTAQAAASHVREASEAGANGYVIKPIEFEDLEAQIVRVLGRRANAA